MLLSLLPLPVVLSAVGPAVHSLAVSLIIDELAEIEAPVFPREGADTAHLVALPLAGVHASVIVDVNALAVDVVFDEVASEVGPRTPYEFALAVLHAFLIRTDVAGTIGPALMTVAMLLVIEPAAFVGGAIRMGEATEAAGLVILPVTLVYTAVGIDQPAVTMSLATLPVALIEASIRVKLGSLTVLFAFFVPFTFVEVILFLLLWLPRDSLLEVVGGGNRLIVEVTQFTPDLVNDLLAVIVLFRGQARPTHHSFRLKRQYVVDGRLPIFYFLRLKVVVEGSA